MLIFYSDCNRIHNRMTVSGNGTVLVDRSCLVADSVYNLDTLGHISEGGILAVKEGAVLVNDEEL